MFNRILIANRGEIACRVMRTCGRLGIGTVAVYSDADADALHVREADMALPVGGARPADSYLRIEAILDAARRSGAEAIHPGYGFLSENAAFARAVREAGLVFIGPDPESMEKMGSKAAAKALMESHGVPVVPGYHGDDQTPARLNAEAGRIGFPLMIKAAAGGGGKGMRITHEAGTFDEALASAQREAQGAFGDSRVILERYLTEPRHIEFQVFGDRHGGLIHLNERDCSAQRRYQKIIEESPAPAMTHERRAAMGEAAVAVARAVDYVGAGTVEFIVDKGGDFYFMEMNTRLQVEHPVTEMVLGVDLVEWQIRVAAGEPLPWSQEQVQARGHAVEVRIYAEDPARGFLPGSGRIERLTFPDASAQVRIDSGVVEGDTVSIHYDPMIAKLIAHGATRDEALARLRAALAATLVRGPSSNIAFLLALLDHEVVRQGRIDTGWLDRHLDQVLDDAAAPESVWIAAAARLLLDQEVQAICAPQDPYSPWARADAWRIGHPGKRLIRLQCGSVHRDFAAYGCDGSYQVNAVDGQIVHTVDGARLIGCDVLHLRIDGSALRLGCIRDGDDLCVHFDGRRHLLHSDPPFAFEGGDSGSDDSLRAPMPGRIIALRAAAGDTVAEDAPLLVMEAMKMEITLRAPRAGTVDCFRVAEGDFVEADTVLVSLASEED
ncbi:MAG TPA: biotin carboxylase N-terminal domain-containing protein [Xanthomonadaceae bacterium]|nr:biotin carboxylase N-terminal domain-containing protein [Xanthomonadaceae bacterium]